MAGTDPLARYHAKRDFAATPEPAGETAAPPGAALAFVVQKHDARRLHYDFRLELGGTLKSWALPKGPSLDAAVKRMAVEVEDHPLDYAGFEGTIPEGHYGAGTVIVWDRGTWQPLGDPQAGLQAGRLDFELHGDKLAGRWTLVRMKPRPGERQPSWLLMKKKDAHARPESEYDVVAARPDSVLGPPSGAAPAPRPVDAKAPAPTSAPMPSAKPARPKQPAKTAAPAGDVPPPAITHPERIVDAASGVTKGRLAAHYDRVADLMLPHLAGRPLSLLRAPAGLGARTFFQRHAGGRALAGVERLDAPPEAGPEPLLTISGRGALLSAVQMNVIEFHTWNATAPDLAHPDRLVFDLDPGEGVAFAQVREAALQLRAFLDDLGLPARLKTSGGKGLHVVVPHAAAHGWDAARDFSRAIVEQVAALLPRQFVARSGAEHRVGRIYVDALRNGIGASTVCAWSVRARPGLGVSVPVGWDEIDTLSGGAHWTVADVADRLALGNAPWQDDGRRPPSLTRAMEKLGFDPRQGG